MVDLAALPTDLPVPVDDGACAHLVGMTMPRLSLAATADDAVDLAALTGRTVVFAYPMTGQPGVALPEGWDAIPGARGCTPQNCAFRDNHAAFIAQGVRVFGLSSQPIPYQKEMATRLHLPYPVLSDEAFALTDRLRLPTFEVEGIRLLRRVTLVIRDGVIEHVFYPVFPSDRSAETTLAWLGTNPLV